MSTPKVSLGDLFHIERGGSPRPIQRFLTNSENGINWIMIGDTVVGSKYITHTKNKIIKEGIKKSREVFPGDFILSNSMSFGRPYILKISGCIHDGWLVLRPKTKNIDKDFIFHLLSSPIVFRQFKKKAAGATVKNLNKGLVSSVQVSLPPLDKQRQIAKILDGIEELIKTNNNRLRLIDNIIQSKVRNVFYKVPENTWIPLEKITDKITVGFVGPTSKHEVENGIPLLRNGNIHNGKINLNKLIQVSSDFHIKNKKSALSPGDVVIARHISKKINCAVIPETISNTNCANLIIIRPGEKLIPEYIYAIASSEIGSRTLLKRQVGTAQKVINTKTFASWKIPVLAMQEQLQLGVTIKKQNELNQIFLNQQKRLEELKNSISDTYFSL